MTIKDKRKYINKISKRYHASGKVKRGQILDEVCAIFEISRGYATRLLNTGYKRHRKRPGKTSRYASPEFLKALKQLWFASQWSCGKLLKASIPLLLPHLERRHRKGIDEEVRGLLLSISAASIDRVLAPYRARYKRGRSLTKPGSILRSQIPIATLVWDIEVPGFVEADSVSHCGNSTKGPFVITLTLTDIATAWTENRAVWTKLAENVVRAIRDIEEALPFPIVGFDCDNGS